MSSLFLVSPEHPRPAPSKTLDDALARVEALNIRRSFVVEAPAGSGKTGLLMQRYLKLLTDDAVHNPDQVLAITFTVRATAELRERVLSQLAAARDGSLTRTDFDQETRQLAESVLARDREYAWGLMDSPGRLNIRTIDSVCSQIVRSLPILSGNGGALGLVANAEPLYREAAQRTLMLLGGYDAGLNEALETLLLHRDGDLGNCERLLTQMLGWREQWGELVPLGKSNLDEQFLDGIVLPKLERVLEQVICRALTHLGKIMPPELAERFAIFAHKMSGAEGYKGAESPIAICSELKSAPGQAAQDLALWHALVGLAFRKDRYLRVGFTSQYVGFKIGKEEQAELRHLVSRLSETPGLCDALSGLLDLPPLRYPADQWHVSKALLRVLSHASIELQLAFSNRGQCDFQEMSLLAKQALQQDGSKEGLSIALGSNLQHLLVDEMQDTSNSQNELLRLLTQGWDGRNQTLFLVGDPNQSIYLFRQARVERFVQAIVDGRLGDVPLRPLHLTSNFRSQHALVADFNQNFSSIFSGEITPLRPNVVPYFAVRATRSETAAQGWVWHSHLIPHSYDQTICTAESRSQTKQDALVIRRIVAEWRSRPLPPERTAPWRIAVLVRSRAHLAEVTTALKHSGEESAIPFRAIEVEPLGERQEVLDAVALTRALLHPADRTAWFALLRTPYCGLTLRDLHLLAGADDEAFRERSIFGLIAERGHELSEDGCTRLARIWPVMQAAEDQRGLLPLDEWVARTWHSLGARVFATEEEAQNVRRYFDLLNELERPGGGLNLAMLQTRLGKLFAEPSLQQDAVDLITIHKAKGLEWDVVLVPSLEKQTRRETGQLLTWMEIESGCAQDSEIAHGILAPIAGKGQEKQPLNYWMKCVADARERAEQKRLLYVACTRAREELHLFGALQQQKDGSVAPPPGSLLASAWPAASSYFQARREGQALHSKTILNIAASTPARSRALPLLRIPNSFPVIQAPSRLSKELTAQAYHPIFQRLEGSFSTRSFGSVMHSMLEALSRLAGSGRSREQLLREVPQWHLRIINLLRASGLPLTQAERQVGRIVAGLTSTLHDSEGWWLLSPRASGRSEESIVSWHGGNSRQIIRVDRLFHAGAEPGLDGDSHLWIVDYKTSTHGKANIDNFLEFERERYGAQLETYATTLAKEGHPLRLALYYPMLPKLVWWQA